MWTYNDRHHTMYQNDLPKHTSINNQPSQFDSCRRRRRQQHSSKCWWLVLRQFECNASPVANKMFKEGTTSLKSTEMKQKKRKKLPNLSNNNNNNSNTTRRNWGWAIQRSVARIWHTSKKANVLNLKTHKIYNCLSRKLESVPYEHVRGERPRR